MANDLFFHTHTHSHYSVLDGMSSVKAMVERVIKQGQPGMALTDHGVMSGTFKLYKGLRKAGLLPFPGIEAYTVETLDDKKPTRYHATMFALDTDGYESLVALHNASHKRESYKYRPLMPFSLLQQMSDDGMFNGVVCTSGCWYGWVQSAFHDVDPTDGEAVFEATRLATRRAKLMASMFPHYYIELQHHDRPEDEWVNPIMHGIAVGLGLPVIITQDAHYCNASQATLHGMMKQLAYGGEPGDVEFPGDGYHLASTNWMRAHFLDHDGAWEDAMSTFEFLIDNHRVKLPFLDNYQYHVPQIVKDPDGELVSVTLEALEARGLHTKKRYADRLSYELGVVNKLGMADYFHIVADLCQWCREEGILINARGSANGSLICYLMDIIDLDPIQWGLSFDRFMSLDRERPPDIDIDIEDRYRDRAIEYLRSKYPEVFNICTFNRLGVNDEGGGGIFVTFLSAMRKKLGDGYKAIYGNVKHIGDLRPIHGKQYVDDLFRLSEETIYRSPGTHAAGLLLGTEDHPIERQMPLMLIPSSNTTVTGVNMDDAEDGGWIKLDLLGSATLSVVSMAFEMLGMEDWHSIPLNDSKVFSFIRQGRTNTGIFQLEGYTMARGCKEMGVRSINDLAVVNALYRPAVIDAGHVTTYLRNRSNPDRIYYHHDVFRPILEPTYGIPVYQEQLLDMFRALGYPQSDLNRMLKAIKASNDKVAAAEQTFRELHSLFVDKCKAIGMGKQDIDELWSFIQSFSNYSFNKAHATAYGLLGYRTAWLKINEPLAYQAALLRKWSGTDKEAAYLRDTRRMGLRVLPADVNESDWSWTMDKRRQAVRRGLLSIKGVGDAAASIIAANRPYTDMDDFIARTEGRGVTGKKDWPGEVKGTIKALYDAGALNSLLTKEDQA